MPSGFLLQYTASDVITCLHKVFPTLMNGFRCIISSFDEPKEPVVKTLQSIRASTVLVAKRMTHTCRLAVRDLSAVSRRSGHEDGSAAASIACVLSRSEADFEQSRASQEDVRKMEEALARLKLKPDIKPRGPLEKYRWVGYICIYLVSWWLYNRYVSTDVAASTKM